MLNDLEQNKTGDILVFGKRNANNGKKKSAKP